MNELRWRCRRGMRELDLFLYRFLDEKYDKLSEDDKRIFKLILDQSDQDLLSWLMGHSFPEEENLRRMIDEIRMTTPTPSLPRIAEEGEGGGWKQFLKEVGARFDGDRVNDFGYPEFERAQTLGGNIIADLSHYGLIQATGREVQIFLAAQFTSDFRKVSDTYSQLSAWCTPKGRVLVVFRIFRRADAYYLLLPRESLNLTMQRLRMYILRSHVTLDDASDTRVRIGLSGSTISEQIATVLGEPPVRPNEALLGGDSTVVCIPGLHPRFLVIGKMEVVRDLWRQLQKTTTPVGAGAWALLDIMAGIPSVVPSTSEAFLPQMLNLEVLEGLSFTKGCYPGQEVIARLKYRGQLKRRMYLALADTDLVPKPGETLFNHKADDKPGIGQVVSAELYPDGRAALLAVIEISAAEQGNVCLYHPDGPLLTFQTLPYTI